jgi:hypothetical protein
MHVPLSEDTVPDGGLVRVQANDRVLEFPGHQIGAASTREMSGKPRWTEMALWRIDDGTGRYVLQRIGRSRIYHRDGGSCHLGSSALATDAPRDARPCPLCSPPHLEVLLMTPESRIALETDHFAATVCDNATDVLHRLRFRADQERLPITSVSGNYSAPAQRILDEASQKDEEIRAALMHVERL